MPIFAFSSRCSSHGRNGCSGSSAATTSWLAVRVIGVYNALLLHTIASFWELFWAAFVVPIVLPSSGGAGADALQAPKRRPAGRARRLGTSYRHQGTGVEILDSRSDARGPGGDRAVRAAARDPRKRPAPGRAAPSCPRPTLQPSCKISSPRLCYIALRVAPGPFQHKVSCPKPKKTIVLGLPSAQSERRSLRPPSG